MCPELGSEGTQQSSDSKGVVSMKTKKKPLDKNAERFYCPYPGCSRSFAELWRLKVHYRAPPDIRGSGKERGHGTELSCCPRCGKTLIPGKHHTGCTQNQSLSHGTEAEEEVSIGANVKSERAPQANGWDISQYINAMPQPPPGGTGMPSPQPTRVQPHHRASAQQSLPGDPLQWCLPEMSGPTAMSTCSTTTATMIAHEQASSWHMHPQQLPPYQQSGMLSESGAVKMMPNQPHQMASPPPLPPLPGTQAPQPQVTRTHWRAWAECGMQTDLGAPFWPLNAPFPGFPPQGAYVAESPHDNQQQRHSSAHLQQLPMMEPVRANSTQQPLMHPSERSGQQQGPTPMPQPQQHNATHHAAAGPRPHPANDQHTKQGPEPQPDHNAHTNSMPAPHFDRPSHPGSAPAPASHHHNNSTHLDASGSIGAQQLEHQRSSSNVDPNGAGMPHDTFPPMVEGFNGIMPHPPSSPPADDFDHLANMLFDFSHFDNTVKKELSTEPASHDFQPLPGDDFMDDLYACDMANDDHSVFKILFEDEHHNTTSITSHMHRQRELSFNLDDEALVDQTMP